TSPITRRSRPEIPPLDRRRRLTPARNPRPSHRTPPSPRLPPPPPHPKNRCRGGSRAAPCSAEVYRAQVRTELVGQVRPPQREIDDGLQKPQLVAGIVAHAVDAAAVDRTPLQQVAQAVGELDLAGAVLA